MAPVKRSTTASKPVSRTIRGSAVAKKKSAATDKSIASPVSKQAVSSSKNAVQTRRSRRLAEEQRSEDPVPKELVVELQGPTKNRSSKNISTKQPTTTAPRRRIKVTPLDSIEPQSSVESSKRTRTRNKEQHEIAGSDSKVSKISRQERDEDIQPPSADTHMHTRSRRVTRKALTEPDQTDQTSVPPKTRGRTKKDTEVIADRSTAPDESQVMETSRTTRTARARSVQTPEVTASERSKKPAARVQKKVTFQDLPQNDKENRPLPNSKNQKATLPKASSGGSGLKAKPVRKAADRLKSSKAKKSQASVAGSQKPEASIDETEVRLPSVLTPKKITQVARSMDIHKGANVSDGEDELNGGKTPVRDLTASPRRPVISTLARAQSPTKLLSFAGSGVPTSPSKNHLLGPHGGLPASGVLASPARRLPPSPFKDSLKDSPRRGLGESLKIGSLHENLFQADATISLALAAPGANPSHQVKGTLLQSPKRIGDLDAQFFSQSAVKRSTNKSPLRPNLLGSPAKRLFSPSKKLVVLPTAKISDIEIDLEHSESSDQEHALTEDITVSSHFRTSLSPVRPCIVDQESSDFDQSILPIGSPLKLQKSCVTEAMPTQGMPPQEPAGFMLQMSSIVPDTAGNHKVRAVDPVQLSSLQEQIDIRNTPDRDLPTTMSSLSASDKHWEIGDNDDDQLCDTHWSPDQVSEGRSPQMLHKHTGIGADLELSADELNSSKSPKSSPFTALEQSSKTRLSRPVRAPRRSSGQGSVHGVAETNRWLASSPEKTPMFTQGTVQRQGSFEFSPLAKQHIDNHLTISDNATPMQKLRLRQSLAAQSARARARPSVVSRNPTRQRRSLALSTVDTDSLSETPARVREFEEIMEMRDLYANTSADTMAAQEDVYPVAGTSELAATAHLVSNRENDLDLDSTIALEDLEDDCETAFLQEPGLHTDLIQFTHASDTAMIDFEHLAQEANNLARSPPADNVTIEVGEHQKNHSTFPAADQLPHKDEDEDSKRVEPMNLNSAVTLEEVQSQHMPTPSLDPTTSALGSPSTLFIDDCSSSTSSSRNTEPVFQVHATTSTVTPLRAYDQADRPRVFNTVISKVPLKPEGQVSPIKIPRKRARSFGNNENVSSKRLSLGSLQKLVVPGDTDLGLTPDQRVRTSAAPSPGGTSTPATQYSRASLGASSALTTPGNVSFSVNDFGDSTLDGIEIPDTDILSIRKHTAATPPSARGSSEPITSDAAHEILPDNTPLRSKKKKKNNNQSMAPVESKKTPTTVRRAESRKSTSIPARTPLKPVNEGALSGAVVFVDVHTSEGTDASGIFMELLSQMGAKCVKDWRWNSRASLGVKAEIDEAEQRIGITHVVYKDGSPRTLEKVRAAKGAVWCVGCTWVLDCERANKWLDENQYVVDASLIPRGGSRRRKSMEPRALLVGGNGAVSAGKPRRSISAEIAGLMKRELLSTPGRTDGANYIAGEAEDDSEDDDDADLENQEMATPTGYVAYDPRTAMTPGTPYITGPKSKLVQMTAPPKQQTGRRLFSNEDDDNDNDNDNDDDIENDITFMEGDNARGLDGDKSVRDAKKFRMKNLSMKNRRRTLGFQPVVGSPLSRL